MGFSFNPLLWFVCVSCKEAFPSTEELKEHKLKQHLGDCLRIKCIIFEEKFVDDAWTPLNRNSTAETSNELFLLPKRNLNSDRVQRFQNPYISLRRLPPVSNSILPLKRKSNSAQKSQKPSEASPSSTSKRFKRSQKDHNETYKIPPINIPEPIPTPISLSKDEAEENYSTEFILQGKPSSSLNFAFIGTSNENENPTSNCNPLQPVDTEFIISSIAPSIDSREVEFPPFSFPLLECQSTPTIEDDTDWGFEFQPVDQADSLLDPENSASIIISPTTLTLNTLDPEPTTTSQAEFRTQCQPEPATENFVKHKHSSRIHKCTYDQCSETFKAKKLLESHQARHNRERKESLKQMIYEKRKVSSTPFFPCPFCSESFFTITQLKNHTIIHPRTKSFKCYNIQCLASFETVKGLKKHLMKEHESQHGIDSEKNFDLHLPLLQWLLLQEEKNPTNLILLEPDPKISNEFQPVSKSNIVKCKLCEERFVSELDLRWHVSKCFLFNKERHRYCPECDRNFASLHSFRKHTSIMHSTDPRPTFRCSVCSKEFVQENAFKFHQTTHELPKGFESDDDDEAEGNGQEKKSTYFRCKFCDKSFMLPCLLRNHERIHTGECPFKCDVGDCEKAYPKKKSLMKHRLRKHMEELGHPGLLCPTCGKKFADKCSLKKHIHCNHDDSKPFQCTFGDGNCSRAFKNKSQLDVHIRIVHTGEKPFQCDQCGKGFPLKSSLQKHIKRTHEGFRSEKVMCSLCPRGFKDNFYLRKHMKTHVEGNKSFKCNICGFLSAGLAYLRRHENMHGKRDGDGNEDVEKELESESDSDGDD